MTAIPHDPVGKLARMAGQIADFFKSYPEDQAATAIAAHINKFWNKRMRLEFLAHFTTGDPRLHPLASKAIIHIKGQES